MTGELNAASERAAALAARLHQTADRLLAVIATIDDDRWHAVPGPGVWSIGREAEHVAEAAEYHRWIVRMTIGEAVSVRRPVLERRRVSPIRGPRQVIERIRQQTDASVSLIVGLRDEQLDLQTRPPRANAPRLAQTIERVLVGHYEAHRAGIEGKLVR